MVVWRPSRRVLGRGRAWLFGAHWAWPERRHGAWPERRHGAWCEGRMRLVDRGTSRGPGALHTGCILCFLSVRPCHQCRQCAQGG